MINRFEAGTAERDQVEAIRKEFLLLFPAADATSGPPPNPGRVGGACDFTLDNNLEPLDPTRTVELVMVADDQFSETRRVV